MRVTILIETELDGDRLFLLNRLADRWAEKGNEIRFRRLSDPPEATDLAILHADRTRLSSDLITPHLTNSPVINGRALDISKRHISRQLCHPGDGYAGPVIIKTDCNSWGMPERIRANGEPSQQGWTDRLLFRLQVQLVERIVPWRILRKVPHGHYPVLDRPDQVPDWVWESEDLVVERFVPERQGNDFVTRYWVFFGDREVVYTKRSPDYLVKRGDAVSKEIGGEIPEELRLRRRELGFDFGKFDWVMHEGRPILLDVNRTPSFRHVTAEFPEIVPELAAGLADFRTTMTLLR